MIRSVEYEIIPQNHLVPLNDAFKTVDVITNIGLRFQNIYSENGGKLTIDYIYFGKNSNDTLFFDVTGDQASRLRYASPVYTYHNFDYSAAGTWATNYNGAADAYTLDNAAGVLRVNVTEGHSGNAANGNLTYGPWPKTTKYYHTMTLQSTDEIFPLMYEPSDTDYLQLRFKTSHCVVDEGKTPRVVFEYYYTKDGVRSAATDVYATWSMQEDTYLTLTIPMSNQFKTADVIENFGLRFQNIKSSAGGIIEIDYIYVGPRSELPATDYTVTFQNWDGTPLQTQGVLKGESVSYSGATPTKPCNATYHYSFKGWDKSLTNVTANMTFTAQFTESVHTYTYSDVDASGHTATCACGYSKTEGHSFSYSATDSNYYHDRGCVCGYSDTSEGHQYSFTQYSSSEHTRICAKCGFTDRAAHVFAYTSTGSEGHARYCKWCKYEDAVEHAWDSGVASAEASCTADGEKLYTCSHCTATKTERIPMLGHTEVIDEAVAPTCTETGLTEGSHCETCGEVIVARGILDTLGHAPVYADNGDKTHTVTCENCDYSEIADCVFENGTCVCGATEIAEPIYDDAVKFSHSLTLENDISINFIALGSALEGYDSFYLECKVPVYSGNELTGYEIVNIEPVYNGKNYEFTLTGVTAKMMNDDIEAVLRMTKDGQEYYSKTDVYSVAEYAYGKLDSTKATDTDALKAICANLLRYGALAQTQFGYRTDALVDASMTDAHKSYLTDLATVEMKDYRKQLNDLETVIVPWKSTTLELGNKVIMCLIVNLANYTGNPAELTMRLTYVDSNGLTVTEERPLELYNPDAQTYAVSYDGLRATEMRSIVSAAIYNGDTRVSKTVEYSIESYGARSTDATMRELCLAMLAYGDAANAFFSK